MMPTSSPTAASRDDWAAPLAALVSCIRHLSGGAPWDVPGIRAQLHQAKRLATPDRIAVAAIEWAVMRPDMRAPIGLADDGPWWHTGRTPDARVARVMCHVDGHEYEPLPCRSCRADTLAAGYTGPSDPPAIRPDQASTNASGAALVRAAMSERSEG